MKLNEREMALVLGALSVGGSSITLRKKITDLGMKSGLMENETPIVEPEEIHNLMIKLEEFQEIGDLSGIDMDLVSDEAIDSITEEAEHLGQNVAGMVDRCIERSLEEWADSDDADELDAICAIYIREFMATLLLDALRNWPGITGASIIIALKDVISYIEGEDVGDDGDERICGLTDDEIENEIALCIRKAVTTRSEQTTSIFDDVVFHVSGTGAMKVGFMTPDEFAELDLEVASEHVVEAYGHWYDAHLQRVCSLIPNVVQDLMGQGLDIRDGISLFSLGDYKKTGIVGGSLAEFYLEQSSHTDFDVKSAVRCQGAKLFGGNDLICATVAFFDAKDDLCGQMNIFHSALTTASGDEDDIEEMVNELSAVCEKLAIDNGCAYTDIGKAQVAMCTTHRKLIAPFTDSASGSTVAHIH